jgi:hypothetical protein
LVGSLHPEPGIREAFLERHAILEKDALDARNSPERPPIWSKQVADKFNDPNFTATTEVFPELHSDFMDPISINRSGNCPNDITVELVEFWVTDQKAKLLAACQAKTFTVR